MTKKLGIYIHIPFCMQKCVYCDFLSAPAGKVEVDGYIDALIKEIKIYSYLIESNKLGKVFENPQIPLMTKNEKIGHCNIKDFDNIEIDSIFFGGGTPSFIDEQHIVDVLDAIRRVFSVSTDAEITIECNPGTINESKARAYRQAGINRLSFGLQSANDDELKLLGRIHDFETFKSNYEMVRKLGFDNVNVDFISAIPGQTIESYENSLKKVLELNPSPEHISAYSLIVEEGTYLYDNLEEFPDIPDEEVDRLMYTRTKEILKSFGYERYEISNYSKPGYECKHNLKYWNREEYLGFGLGAAGFVNEVRYSNRADRKKYMDGIEYIYNLLPNIGTEDKACGKEIPILLKQNCFDSYEILSNKDAYAEFMFLGLRTTSGVSENSFLNCFGKSIYNIYKKEIDKNVKQGLLARESGRIFLTERGLDISNTVMADFIID